VRLAWFRPAPLAPESAFDATAPIIAALHTRHDLDLYTAANAHDFVWTHDRRPYELPVFELDDTAAHAFVWPYLLHYGGLLLLHSATLHDSRARALLRVGRRDDYAAEFSFNEGSPSCPVRTIPAGDWPMLRAPLTAARCTAVPNRGFAQSLRDAYPDARVAYAPLAVEPAVSVPTPGPSPSGVVTFGMLASDRVDAASRALARAQALGAQATLTAYPSHEEVLPAADVVLALSWPPHPSTQHLARAARAAGLPVVAPETTLTADWPALDPQTWQPRGTPADAPIGVTIDLRDEEHSLALAIRRLAADASLRLTLGETARAWSRTHEGVAAAVGAWERILDEAARLDPPIRPVNWPTHLTADGTERARAMLAEFGVSVDLF
jgi:hypothetical protein